jgi:sialate O-acetylesterase
MRVTRGLAPFQVLQRDARGRAAAVLSGDARAEGVVWAKAAGPALSERSESKGWRRAGLAHDGIWEARLEGLRVGGPYRIEAEIRLGTRRLARVVVPGILVGDLWVLAGQSNMEGVGVLQDVEAPHPLVHNFGMGGAWGIAREPLHWLPESPDSVHWWGMNEAQRNDFVKTYRKTRDRGAGPGLAFAKRLVEATGVPIGLLPTAHGGTNMDQWSPGKRDQGGRSLYGSMDRTVRAAGGTVAGVLWYQGESEGFEQKPSPFLERFLGLVTAIRRDLHAPRLPFLYVQIGRVVMKEIPVPRWTEIRELQRRAESRLPRLAMVTAIDLPLDDAIHISTPGHHTLGLRLAQQALRLVFGRRDLSGGPRPVRARAEGPKRTRVRLTLRGANGRLGPARNIRGFSVRDARGQDLDLVYEAMTDRARPRDVVILVRDGLPKGATLWYGYGLDPVCTLTDAAGNAAPAFGPLTIV